MLPARKGGGDQQQETTAINFDPSSSSGGGEFGVPALQGYTFRLHESRDGVQELVTEPSQGTLGMATLPEFVVDAAGGQGVDGSDGEHGMHGNLGANGQDGKDGYGPGRPGKPGRSGKDGKQGTAGKKGKKGTNGMAGGRGLNVFLSLSGEGPELVDITGHLERVVKQIEPSESTSCETEAPVPLFVKEPLLLSNRFDAYWFQPSLSESGTSTAKNRSMVTVDSQDGSKLGFRTTTGVIFIDAHGGRGGNGGNGGKGGKGGDGGDGGNGGKGGDGRKGMKPGLSGENGGRGGDGGAGMAGAPGGDGAPAGKGGNAGSGGQVTIETTKPELLMLVEADTRAGKQGLAGKPGNGGEGGKAGIGGRPGRGGTGGPPWDKLYLPKHHKTKYYSGCVKGRDGTSGRPGGLIGPKIATAGIQGSTAPNGKDGKNGKVTWILKSPEGEVIEKAKNRYNCALYQYRVRSTSSNGIISPGGIVVIDKVTVCNNGGMTLPAGTLISFGATGGVLIRSKGNNKVEILPSLSKNKRHKCNTTFSIALEKLEGPAGGAPFQALISVAPYLELGGRTFPVADQVMEIPVQYPVRIADDVQFPHTVHQGAIVSLKVNLQNISSRTYGGGRSKNSLGTVTILVILFLELEGGERIDYTWRREVPEIGAGLDHKVEVDCRIDTNAQPYSLLSLQTHLLLNNQSIEFRHVESRVIPVYGGADIDAVLLTDTDFRPGAYKLWKGILAFLGLKCVFWDIGWYRTYSMGDLPWLGKHRLVIFTHLQEDNFNSLAYWIRSVLPPHISALGGARGVDNAAAIFIGPTYKEVAREMVDWNNGERLKDVTTANWMTSCYGTTDEEALKQAVLKASKLQKQLRAHDQLQEYRLVVAPMKRDGSKTVPLVLYRETLPALFNTNSIPLKMYEDPAGVDLLARSPLMTLLEAPDIYSGISTAIAGLITNSSSAPVRQPGGSGHPIVLDGKYLTLGYMIAGMIVSLPIQFRLDLLFRFAGHPASDIPVLSSSSVAFTEVIGMSFYYDLKSDWLCQRHTFPHGQILVEELKRAAYTRGFMTIVEIKSFVIQLTSGLILLREEFRGFTPSKTKARHLLKGMLKEIQVVLGGPRSIHVPKVEMVRALQKNLQPTLPPWMFAAVDELEVIRIVDDRGNHSKKEWSFVTSIYTSVKRAVSALSLGDCTT